MENKQYTKLKEECKKQGCFCPVDYICSSEIANTPLWLRIYFREVEDGK